MSKKFSAVLKISVMAMLVALAIVSLFFIRFPLIPSAPFLEYDCADIPALIASLVFGPVSGLAVLFCVCIIQAFTVSASSGIIGFFMHFIASCVLILIPSLIYKKKKSVKSLVIGLIIASAAMTLVMIPLNLVFTGIFMGVGTKQIVQMLIPAIIPFNLAKACINSVATLLIYIPLSKTKETEQG
ncbi:MAG: ECF transporter S component [Clostridiales bacterium]|nr:ECF transporter S component [Clostridiales bacterium]